ncbi:MAG: nucleotidyltransferase, partial [Lachnospiraceae bacterium]|nr:nucleotidyltransferase [Lachnospiraceae bacterium]
NGGIYLIKRKLIEKIPTGKVSLENEMMQKWIKDNIKIGACIENSSFIDIGTPDSYKEINS